jgi:hypothetical protein
VLISLSEHEMVFMVDLANLMSSSLTEIYEVRAAVVSRTIFKELPT